MRKKLTLLLQQIPKFIIKIVFHAVIMSGIAPKQNAFKFKIAPHKQTSIVNRKNNLTGR
jgi:hypothetical protein